mgnify:CR=1 FL=1
MASRAQQVYAGQRKFGHAMSIVSVLQGNEKGTKEYQQWKALLHHFYDPFPTVEHYR